MYNLYESFEKINFEDWIFLRLDRYTEFGVILRAES